MGKKMEMLALRQSRLAYWLLCKYPEELRKGDNTTDFVIRKIEELERRCNENNTNNVNDNIANSSDDGKSRCDPDCNWKRLGICTDKGESVCPVRYK